MKAGEVSEGVEKQYKYESFGLCIIQCKQTFYLLLFVVKIYFLHNHALGRHSLETKIRIASCRYMSGCMGLYTFNQFRVHH